MGEQELNPQWRLNEVDVRVNGDQVLFTGPYYVVHGGTLNGVSVFVKAPTDRNGYRDLFANEVRTLSEIRHPNCCEFLGYLEHPLRVVMRGYATTLRGLTEGMVPINERFRIASQIVSALQFIYSNGLTAPNLGAENVFIDENGDARVAVFGLVTEGLPLYESPETLRGSEKNERSDVYSFGVMLWELFVGRRPFEGVSTQVELMARQEAVPMLPFDEDILSRTVGDGRPPREILQLASRCYDLNPMNRPALNYIQRMIVDIGVGYVINRSQTAANFWKAISSYTYRSHVLLSQFVEAMRESLNNRGGEITVADIERTLRNALPQVEGSMTIEEFWNLCCWFPNSFCSPHAFASMENCVRSLWYCRDQTEANHRLSLTEGNTFVIRPSTTNRFSNPFTICARTEGHDSFYRISRLVNEERVCFTSTITGETVFENLSSLALYLTNEIHIHSAPRDEDEGR